MELIFIFGSLTTILGIYFFPKSKIKLNGIAWVFYSLVLYFCINSILAEILVIFNLKADLAAFSAFYFCVSIICLFFYYRTKFVQKFVYNKADIFFSFLILICSVIVALLFFKFDLNIVYESSDPSRHFKWALEFANDATFRIGAMNFHLVNTGLVLQIFGKIVDPFNLYKVFILCDIFYFCLYSVLFFFSLNHVATSKSKKLILFLATVLFSLGYPLNTLIFGFGYFQTGMIIITLILVICNLFYQDLLDYKVFLLLCLTLIWGLWNSYLLFIPAVYLAIGILFLYKWPPIKRKNIRTLTSSAKISLFIPFAVSYLFFILLPTKVESPGFLTNDGYIFKELYMDFLLFFPLAIFTLIRKNKNTKFLKILFISQLLIMMIMFIAGLNGYISPYYYYKNNYFFWYLVLAMFAVGLINLMSIEKGLFKATILSFGIILFLSIGQIDVKIQNINHSFNPENRISTIVPVINFNVEKISESSQKSTQEKIDLFLIAKKLFVENSQEKLPIISFSYSDGIWYQVLVGAYPEATANNEAPILNPQETYDAWEESNSEYLLFVDNKKNYQIVLNQLIHNHNEYFKNDAGYIFKK